MADMDPTQAFTGAFSLAGLGMSIAGGMEVAKAEKQLAGYSQQNAGLEYQIDQQKRTMMELTAKRQSLEDFRNAQKAASLARMRATSQGAQFGSGLQGGLNEIKGQSGVNQLAIGQNLGIGENIFNYNAQIDQNKFMMAGLQTDIASGQGLASLGGALSQSGAKLGSFFGNFGTSQSAGTSDTSYGGQMGSSGFGPIY